MTNGGTPAAPCRVTLRRFVPHGQTDTSVKRRVGGAAAFIIRVSLFGLISINAFAAAGSCPAGLPVTGNNCYFIAANGADTNNGTSESTPWLHAPGMPNCTGNCAAVTPQAGNGFIFRGADTWHFGNSGASPYTGGAWDINQWWGAAGSNCQYEGSQTACIYWGVDTTWHAGSAWSRPTLTGDNPASTSLVASCAYQVRANTHDTSTNALIVAAPQSIIDNFELTGMCSQDSTPTSGVGDTYIEYFGTGVSGSGMSFMENLYIHGWTATTAAGQGNDVQPGTLIGGGNNGIQTLDHIVIDGSDSNPGSWGWGTFPSFYHLRDSIVRYTNQGVGQWCHDVHDNIFEHFYNHNSGAGSHTNIFECNDDSNGTAPNQPQNTPNVFYNNIVRHDDPSFGPAGQVHLWFCPETVPEYWFNNLVYDVANENVWDYAGPPVYGCSGTGGQFMFNNTLVDVTQPCYVSTVNHGGQYLTVYNEHLVNTPFDNGTIPCTGLSSATNIAMSDSTATMQGYTTGMGGTDGGTNTCAQDSTTPCAPTSASDSTVGTGANHQNYCTILASYSSEYAIGTEAATACQYGTTDGCAYVTTNHTMVCPGQTAVARPASGAWDSGAYQFAGTGDPPGPPSNLLAMPQ